MDINLLVFALSLVLITSILRHNRKRIDYRIYIAITAVGVLFALFIGMVVTFVAIIIYAVLIAILYQNYEKINAMIFGILVILSLAIPFLVMVMAGS